MKVMISSSEQGMMIYVPGQVMIFYDLVDEPYPHSCWDDPKALEAWEKIIAIPPQTFKELELEENIVLEAISAGKLFNKQKEEYEKKTKPLVELVLNLEKQS